MNYLSPPEYELYGIDTATSESWVGAASVLINAHCRRPTLSISQYTQRLRVRPGRNTVQLVYLPLAPLAPATNAIVSARARYAPAAARKGEDPALSELVYDVTRAFSLPGSWTALDPAGFEYDAELGDVTMPGNVLGIAYNEVEITYTAGLEAIPDEVKFACAQIVRNAQATPALNVRSGSLDSLRLEYFAGALVDGSVVKLLAPYVTEKLS